MSPDVLILFNPETKKSYKRIKCITPGCKNREAKFWMRDGLCSQCQVTQFKNQVLQEMEACQ